MNTKLLILGGVAVAVLMVLWFKPAPTFVEPVDSDNAASVQARANVLLFADPREAEGSCGCAEIIRIARGARESPGVRLLEFDTRQHTEQAERFGVRVSPTVIITGPDGIEQVRFEGESSDVIARLRSAVAGLRANDGEQAGEEPQ